MVCATTIHYPQETQCLRLTVNPLPCGLGAEKSAERRQVSKEDRGAGLYTLRRRPPRRLWVRLPDTHQIGMVAGAANRLGWQQGLGCGRCFLHERHLHHYSILRLVISIASDRDGRVMRRALDRDGTGKDRYEIVALCRGDVV